MRIRTLALLAALLLSAPLLTAQVTTYSYIGQDFTYASGAYTTGDSVTGSFTVSSPLADNLNTLTTISPTSFSFTDGVDTISSNSSDLTDVQFEVETNATGGLTAWDILVENETYYGDFCDYAGCVNTGYYNDISIYNVGGSSGDTGYYLGHEYEYEYQQCDDYSFFGECEVIGTYYETGFEDEAEGSNSSAGLWKGSATPEPPSLLLLATGLFGAAGFLRKKFKSPAPSLTASAPAQKPRERFIERVASRINWRAKVLAPVGLSCLLCLILPRPLRADTVYTYTGNDYNSCFGSYCSGGPYALSITFDVAGGTPLDNLTLFGAGSNITSDIVTFSISDGSGLDNTQANSPDYLFEIGTDSNGDITTWQIYSYGPLNVGFEGSFDFPGSVYDETVPGGLGSTSYGEIQNEPGIWTATATPEPPSLLLLATGLIATASFARRSRPDRHCL